MAELIINPDLVQPIGRGPRLQMVAAGPALAGQMVYIDANRQYRPASNAVQDQAEAVAMLVATGDLGQSVIGWQAGRIFLGAGVGVVAGQWYVVGATPGRIMPVSDLTTGVWSSLAGFGEAGDIIDLQIIPSNFQVP